MPRHLTMQVTSITPLTCFWMQLKSLYLTTVTNVEPNRVAHSYSRFYMLYIILAKSLWLQACQYHDPAYLYH